MEIHSLRRPWLDLAARGWSERTGQNNVCTCSLSEGALFSSASTAVGSRRDGKRALSSAAVELSSRAPGSWSSSRVLEYPSTP